ncbi:MAG: hydroxymethylglutaryl-CoA reductase, degradative [Flavobacteriaceae bacterium]|nr:hydroxymethylglutaryl-CoA reductase, degradative [Flavobacteriaceae bacterium]
MGKGVSGFSKLSKTEKIDWILKNYLSGSKEAENTIKQYWHNDVDLQRLHDEFIENTISNFYLPLGVAPNFLINGRTYAVPMAVEESSVVAAASKSAKYWQSRGGIKCEVISTQKNGQVHFKFTGAQEELFKFFKEVKPTLFSETKDLTRSMESRGGGIKEIELLDKTELIPNYYQLNVSFETRDAMGANFINSCLERIASVWEQAFHSSDSFQKQNDELEIIMSILSNYTPNCVVRASVSCDVSDLSYKNLEGKEFAKKFVEAVEIARVEPYRAVTHNKGIMNGIDAVVIATGNDFRAVEAGIHAYASRNGKYSSLSKASLEDNIFNFSLEIPLAIGTVGGLTNIHPLVKVCLKILQDPTAEELMQIVAATGLIQNFAAVRTLITTGIQQGHMRMHLLNILNRYGASENEKSILLEHFKSNPVNNSAVITEIERLRN